MPDLYDVAAIGNAIVDVIAPATDGFLDENRLDKGAMMLVDQAQSQALYAKMAPGVEASGGSAANTVAGLASFGGKGAFLGKVADDQLGRVFAHDMQSIGARFENTPLIGGPATAVSMINVTPDAQRTMCTYLGASVEFTDADVDPETVEAAKIVYLEGYLFDAEPARRAFAKAAALAHGAGRMIALTLSDSFEAALAALQPHVKLAAVTRSEKGSVILDRGERLSVAAEPVEKVVDTTGAGDQYAAGFMFGLSQGRPLAQCGRLASLAAAEVISHYGPRPQVSLKALAESKGY
jgi:sugar/nucleoside kinase (ribokinase family)